MDDIAVLPSGPLDDESLAIARASESQSTLHHNAPKPPPGRLLAGSIPSPIEKENLKSLTP
jgi:hypothetical protein